MIAAMTVVKITTAMIIGYAGGDGLLRKPQISVQLIMANTFDTRGNGVGR